MESYFEKEEELFRCLQDDDFQQSPKDPDDTMNTVFDTFSAMDDYMNALHQNIHLQSLDKSKPNMKKLYDLKKDEVAENIQNKYNEVVEQINELNEITNAYGLGNFMDTDNPKELTEAIGQFTADIHERALSDFNPDIINPYDKEETRDHIRMTMKSSKLERPLPSHGLFAEFNDLESGYDY